MPPEGIAQLWNRSVLGSNRTSASGLCADSLYQMISFTTVMAYGCDFGPLGEGHSLTSPVFGSSRPSRPRPELTYQIIPSLVISSRRTVVFGSGKGYCRISIVSGSTLSKQLLPLQATHRLPSELTLIPYGREFGRDTVTSLISPVAGIKRPTMLLTCNVNHRVPFLSKTAVCGSRAAGSGILYSVIFPVRGSSLPIVPLLFPVYQMLPCWSGVTVWGLAFSGKEYSHTSPVWGLSWPTRLAHIPAHQIVPSGASTGSRARCPSVGTFHSRNVIDSSPPTRLGFKWLPAGKCVARYFDIVSPAWFPDKLIIAWINSCQPSRVYPELLVIRSVSWHEVQRAWTSCLPSPSGNCCPRAERGAIISKNTPAHNIVDSLFMPLS